MPISISVTQKSIEEELEQIAVVATRVTVVVLDASTETLLIEVVSDDFEGQTYLDREQRTRPAVLRALLATGIVKPSFVMDLETQVEALGDEAVASDFPPAQGNTAEERFGKQRWRRECESVLRALKESDYSMSELVPQRVYIATRERLSEEKILVSFAESPRVQTVHSEALRVMRTARQSQEISAAYYLAPVGLSDPFSNQKPAPWLKVMTSEEFLHHLAGSASVAKNLLAEVVSDTAKQPTSSQGPCIEPEAVNAERTPVPKVFEHIDQWTKRDGASVLILVADAGHGKTTLTRELARRFATNFSENKTGPLPVSVPFESVRRMVDFTALLHLRLAQLRGHAYGAFVELLRGGRAVLFIDGFDELADDAGLSVAEAQVRSIRGLIEQRAKVVLAGRTAFATMFAGHGSIKRKFQALLGADVDVEILEIQPFDRSRIDGFLDTRLALGLDVKAAVKTFIDRSLDHEQLCGNPLFLRMLCSLDSPGAIQTENAADGIRSLLEGICRREEERQHLGIAVKGQLAFLGAIAQDMFASGRPRLPSSDIKVHAELYAESETQSNPSELSARLCSHALLTGIGGQYTSFIHPYIRDIVLAVNVVQLLVGGNRSGASGIVGKWDLPAATVRLLVSHLDEISACLPDGWLSEPSRMTSIERRNWVRVVAEVASIEGSALWLRPEWAREGILKGLDLARLTLSGLAFSNITLHSCLLEGLVFEACRFEGVGFEDCKFIDVTFDDCEFIAPVTATGGIVRSVVNRFAGGVVEANTLAEALVGAVSDPPPAPVDPQLIEREARKACVSVLARLMRELIAQDGRTFSVSEDDLRIKFQTHTEDLVFEKVVLPVAVSRMFTHELGAGSRVHYQVAKEWRGDARQLVASDRQTPRLRELVSKMALRARRYVPRPGE